MANKTTKKDNEAKKPENDYLSKLKSALRIEWDNSLRICPECKFQDGYHAAECKYRLLIRAVKVGIKESLKEILENL